MKKITLIALMLLSSICCYSQKWQLHDPAMSSFVAGDTLYLYNRDAHGFLRGDNDYNTRASLGDLGYKVILTEHLNDDGVFDGKTYVIRDSVETAGKYMQLHDKRNGIWVDNGAAGIQPDTLFYLLKQPDETYYIQPADPNPLFSENGGLCLGVDTEKADTRLYWCDLNEVVEGENMYINWYFVNKENYALYLKRVQDRDASEELYASIQQALELGLDVTAAQNAYDDENNDAATLLAVKNELDTAIFNALSNVASPDNPAVLTDKYFEDPTYATGTSSGWGGTKPNDVGQNAAEFFNMNYDYNRTLQGLAPGIYGLGVQAFYRCGTYDNDYATYLETPNANNNAVLYAGEFSTPIARMSAAANENNVGGTGNVKVGENLYVPNNMTAAHNFFNAGFYKNTLFFRMAELGDITVGINKEQHVDKEWTICSNWSLIYYGNSSESYAFWRDQLISQFPIYNDNIHYNSAMSNEYVQMLEDAHKAETVEEIEAAISAIQDKLDEINANVDAYAQLEDAIDAAEVVAFAEGFTGDAVDQLNDYLLEVAYDTFNDCIATTEEVLSTIATLKEKTQFAIENREASVGSDVTSIITNANFKNNLNGWTVDSGYSTPTHSADNTIPVCEVWNANFNLYQDLENLQDGVYELKVQAFYRTGSNAVAFEEYNNQTAEVLSVIYANDVSVPVVNIMAEAQPSAYSSKNYACELGNTPDDVNSGKESFRKGLYENSVKCFVSDGKLRIGIKNTTGTAAARWTLWGNFRLIYEGYDPSVLRDMLEEQIAEAKTSQNTSASPSSLSALKEAISDASSKLNSNDGKAMFEAAKNLNIAINGVKESATYYSELGTLVAKLEKTLAECERTADETYLDEADELIDEARNANDNSTLENDDVMALNAKIQSIIIKLIVNPQGEASDDNPIDYTAAIINPDYADDNNNGWSGTVPTVGNKAFEFWNKNYDYWQDVAGLPDGTYELSVNAFYRAGEVDDEIKRYAVNPDDDRNAFLYVALTDDTVEKPILRLCDDPSKTPVEGATKEKQVEDGYLPNDFATAALYLHKNKYKNSVVFNVTDGKVRIGLRKSKQISADWIVLTNWKLTYYGRESQITGISDVGTDKQSCQDMMTSTVGDVVYNLAGIPVKINGSGVYIIRTADGQCRKVLVK